MMYQVKGEQNGFTSIPAAMYWAIVTVTTVGYGDISPHTVLGRFIASILMVLGYGIIAVPTGIFCALAALSLSTTETLATANTADRFFLLLPSRFSYKSHSWSETGPLLVISSMP
jgi:voltage-gated potassium channel